MTVTTLNARFLTSQGMRFWKKVPTWRWIRQQQGLSITISIRVHAKYHCDLNAPPLKPWFIGCSKDFGWQERFARQRVAADEWLCPGVNNSCFHLLLFVYRKFVDWFVHVSQYSWYNWFLISPVHGDGCEDDWYLIEAREQSSQSISRHT